MKSGKTFKSTAAFFVTLAATLGSTGCSTHQPDTSRHPVNESESGNSYDDMAKEYAAEKAELTLPTGASWPDNPPRAGADDQYDTGYGTSQADQYWYCSWAREWLSENGTSTSRATEALTQLKTIRQKPLYIVAFAPEVKQATENELASAEAGNRGPLETSVTQNC